MSEQNIDKEIYKRIFSNMPTGFVLYKVNGENGADAFTVEDANMSFSSTIPLKTDNVIGKKVSELLDGSNADEWTKPLEAIIQKKDGANAEVFLGNPYHKWLAVHAFTVDEHHIAATYVDITARKRMESALSLERSMLVR